MPEFQDSSPHYSAEESQFTAPFDFKTSRKGSLEKGSQLYGPLEYLVDDTTQNRSEDDMFHILLLGSTFDKPRITVNYVAGCLSYVIDMSEQDGVEHSVFAEENGFSCLGTWIRKDCLSLGQKLQARDIACRVVPFVTGGFNPWQAKYAEGESISSSPGGDLPASDFL